MVGSSSHSRHSAIVVWLSVLLALFLTLVLVIPAGAQSTSAGPAVARLGGGTLAVGPPPPSSPSATFAPLGHLPIAPTTGPLVTKPQSGHVSSVFAILSIAGFALAALLVVTQLFLTRRARRRRGARTL